MDQRNGEESVGSIVYEFTSTFGVPSALNYSQNLLITTSKIDSYEKR